MFYLVMGSILIFCIYMIYAGIQEKTKEKKQIEKKKKSLESLYYFKCKHICGLSLAENSECCLYVNSDKIITESNSTTITLNCKRIIDISIKNTKEIQNSISGAVGGAMLLGPLGAFIGGSSTKLQSFLIILYKDKENKEICISFDISDSLKDLKKMYEFIRIIQSNKEKREIEM